MTFAIIRSGGRQLKVTPQKQYLVPLMKAQPGDKITITDILLVDDGKKILVGTPTVEGAQVKATVVNHGRLPKIIGFTYKRRNKYRRKWGHRIEFTKISIESISAKSPKAAKATE